MSQPHSRLRGAIIRKMNRLEGIRFIFAVETRTIEGVPDIYGHREDGSGFWIEVKVGRDRLSEIQKVVGGKLDGFVIHLQNRVYTLRRFAGEELNLVYKGKALDNALELIKENVHGV